MINKLVLKNFRKHKDAEFEFGPGLSTLRGQNEAGKSTIGEALLYALFGSKALRTSFAATVTWGEKESSLKVEATMLLDGIIYVFSRSKAGAECAYGDKLVTGQNEVSNFAATLLGADLPTAGRLMVANQGNLRGALEQGPKATAEMIESLANFDLFDVLIDKMQTHLTLGSTLVAESRITEAEALVESQPSEPNHAAAEALIRAREAEAAEQKEWASTVGAPASTAARIQLDNALAMHKMHTQVASNLEIATSTKALHVEQLAANVDKAKLLPDHAEIMRLKGDLVDTQAAAGRRASYDALLKLVEPDAVWEGNLDSLKAEIDSVANKINTSNLLVSNARGDIREAKATMVTSSTCGFCHQDVSQFSEVAIKNRAAAEIITAAESSIVAANKDTAEWAEELKQLQAVLNSSSPFDQYLRTNGHLVSVDTNFVPPRITWNGEAPAAGQSTIQIQQRIDALTEQDKQAQQAAARVVTLGESIVEDDQRIVRLTAQLADNPAADNLLQLRTASSAADSALAAAEGRIVDLHRAVTEANMEIELANRIFAEAKERRQAAANSLTKAKQELADLNFNNQLLKKVRAARPIISDKLWSIVLSSVSTMFSQMRGDKSVVSKGKDGFLVNGEAVESLSGSTLDILSLAIRVSLTKTFIPSLSMMLLDEPLAACDQERSAAMLGFVAGAGFDQTILITHDPISDSFSDALIEL